MASHDNDNRQMELNSLRLLVQAMELGSLSRAAYRSRLALAAVSLPLRRIEDWCDITLLKRTGRGVAPTPAGLALLGHVHAILRLGEIARSDLADYARGVNAGWIPGQCGGVKPGQC